MVFPNFQILFHIYRFFPCCFGWRTFLIRDANQCVVGHRLLFKIACTPRGWVLWADRGRSTLFSPPRGKSSFGWVVL